MLWGHLWWNQNAVHIYSFLKKSTYIYIHRLIIWAVCVCVLFLNAQIRWLWSKIYKYTHIYRWFESDQTSQVTRATPKRSWIDNVLSVWSHKHRNLTLYSLQPNSSQKTCLWLFVSFFILLFFSACSPAFLSLAFFPLLLPLFFFVSPPLCPTPSPCFASFCQHSFFVVFSSLYFASVMLSSSIWHLFTAFLCVVSLFAGLCPTF